MAEYKYIIIGGGMTADAAVRGIRKVDETGSIGLFSIENDPPYNRPLLSKGLWKGKPLEKVWRNTEQFGVQMHLGQRIQKLDPHNKRITDAQGVEHYYNRLLLATGGRPRRLPFGGDDIIYFRTLGDYRRLREESQHKNRFAVIGGGFIGSEIAAALAMNGKEVTMIFPEESIGALVYPADLSHFLNDYFLQKGVTLLSNQSVSDMEKVGHEYILRTTGGTELTVDGVIAGIGIQPNIELAQQAGIEIDDANHGILVSPSLLTSHPNVFAAGDVASFYNSALDTRMRVEHEDNAKKMGTLDGQSMAGEEIHYDYLPYFYSDLFDLGYEAVGKLSSRFETISDWQEPYQKGVIYYLENGRLRGVLLWNVWNKVEAARQLIAEPAPVGAVETLKGRL